MTLRGGKAFKESFQGGAHFSRREEPGYRRQRASVRKKNGFPGGQTLQRELMGAENKRKQALKREMHLFKNLFHIILFIS